MNKKTPTYLTLLILTFFFSMQSVAADRNYWITNDNVAHNVVWENKLHKRISFLTDTLCQGRAAGQRGGTEAAFWIHEKFREAGLMPFGGSFAKHFYLGGGKIGHNIIGMMPGSRKNPSSSYIIVGAHYDHLGILGGRMYPGADSNASGVVAAISLAEMFSAMKTIGRVYGKSIIFVAFDAKEKDMAGSGALWEMIRDRRLADPLSGKPIGKENIYMMVNIDQFGSSLAPLTEGRKDYMIALGNDRIRREDRGLLSMCNRFYGLDMELSDSYYGSRNFTDIFMKISDQKIFLNNGIPSVFLTSGITMNTFKTYDTVGSLDMEVLKKRILLVFHWLEKLMR